MLDASIQNESYFIRENSFHISHFSFDAKQSDAMNLCYNFKLDANDAICAGMLEREHKWQYYKDRKELWIEKNNSQRIGQNWKKKQNKINSIFKLRCWKWKNKIGAVKTLFFFFIKQLFFMNSPNGRLCGTNELLIYTQKMCRTNWCDCKKYHYLFCFAFNMFFFPQPKSASKLMYCVGLNQTNVIIVVQFDVHK